MGLTTQARPGSKASQDWERRTNPLRVGVGVDGDSGDGSRAAAPLKGTSGSKKSLPAGAETPTASGSAAAEAPSGTPSPPPHFPKDVIRTVNGHTTQLNREKQMKHISGSPYYQEGKSILTVSLREAQELVNEFAGTGRFLNPDATKERVDFGSPIGLHVDPRTRKKVSTTCGLIHYSKTGTHIVPALPDF